MLQYLNSRGRFLLSLSNLSTAIEQPCRGITIRHPISSNLLAKVGQGIFKKTKRRAKSVLLSQLLAIYGQEAKPVQAASNGQASTW
jgi:hypothetical protein